MDAEMLLELDAFILEATLLSPEAYVSDPPTVNVHAGVGLSAPPKKPFRKRLPAAERAERRRKQHRELVARGRAKAREFVEELRTQEMALQEKLDALIESYASGQRRPTPTPTAASTGFDIAAIEKTMRGRLIEAVATADSLSWENQRLEEMLDERLKFQQTVLQAGDAMVAESQTMASCELPQENRLLHRRGYWMYFADDDVPFYFEPYAEAKIEEFAAHALNNAKKLHETFEKRKVPGTRCFGWNMQHIYDHNSMTKLRFRFSKQISTSSSAALRQDLVQKSWTIINTPEQYAKMFSEKIVERLLQRVNDHTSFIVRNNPTKLHSRSLRSFSIMRVYTDVDSQGRMRTYIVLQALEPQDTEAVTLQAAKGVTYISTDFSFMSFTELDDRTLEVVQGGTGGVGDVVQEQFASYRLVEIGLSWLLWENMVMPQHLLEAE